MSHSFILIPGRSARQGVTLNEGKYTDGYLDEISTLRMHPGDMDRLQLEVGDEVRLKNEIGEIQVPVISGKDELPEGMLFICYGDLSSQLMGGETHGTGMPDSKGLDVELEVVAAKPAASVATANPVPVRPAAAVSTVRGASLSATASTPHADAATQGSGPAVAILLLVGLFVLIALLLSMLSGT